MLHKELKTIEDILTRHLQRLLYEKTDSDENKIKIIEENVANIFRDLKGTKEWLRCT